MRTIFYFSALGAQSLSFTDKIIYCQMLYLSVFNAIEETYTGTGELDPYKDIGETGYKYIPICDIYSDTVIYKTLGISNKQFYKTKEKLFLLGYLHKGNGDGYFGDCIRLEKGYIDSYFELIHHPGLRGLNLIVYSYICNKTKKFGWIDKYHDAIARELGISPLVLANCLGKLYAMGLVQKKKRYKQVLLRAAPEFYIP